MIDYLRNTVTPFVEDEIIDKISLVKQALAYVSTYILKKTTKSLKAVCELCESDHYEDAQIIARSIYESSLTLAYICKPDSERRFGISIITSDELAQLYILHGTEEQKLQRNKYMELEKRGKCTEWINNIKTELYNNHYQAIDQELHLNQTYIALRGQSERYLVEKNKRDCHTKKTWNLLTLRGSAELLGDPYESDYHFAYWSVSQMAHASVLASFSYYKEPKTTPADMLPPLILGFSYYWRIADNVNSAFKLALDDKINRIGDGFIKLYHEMPESAELR
jgi:hypothetical protein